MVVFLGTASITMLLFAAMAHLRFGEQPSTLFLSTVYHTNLAAVFSPFQEIGARSHAVDEPIHPIHFQDSHLTPRFPSARVWNQFQAFRQFSMICV
jgi:hypothetical protein